MDVAVLDGDDIDEEEMFRPGPSSRAYGGARPKTKAKANVIKKKAPPPPESDDSGSTTSVESLPSDVTDTLDTDESKFIIF